jgi:hypothetical protein
MQSQKPLPRHYDEKMTCRSSETAELLDDAVCPTLGTQNSGCNIKDRSRVESMKDGLKPALIAVARKSPRSLIGTAAGLIPDFRCRKVGRPRMTEKTKSVHFC